MTSHATRKQAGRLAYEALGETPSEHVVLQVDCGRSHHLAGVYTTAAGLVFHSVLHSKAHGRRDRYDGAHHGHTLGTDFYDLLETDDPAASDELDAGCECGPYSLSRALLREHIAAGLKRVVVS